MINSRLTSFLETNKLLGQEQTGFRVGCSTVDHIFTLYCLIDMFKSKKKRLYCAFVDYSKAFDSVDRYSLWQKVLSIGIDGKVLRVIQNMYKNAKSCVQNNSQLSDFFECNIGVRQGENLSPLLFSIFLNDLERVMHDNTKGICLEFNLDNIDWCIKLFTLLYADDTILISETPQDLQNMLNTLYSYCYKWKLKVNASKTKIVIFSRGVVRKHPEWFFGLQKLEVVSSYVYLGVKFNCNGKFTEAIKKQILQARKASFSLIAKFCKFNLPIDIQVHLFDTYIPI